TAAEWGELDVPVGLAFFLNSSRRGQVCGFYPSPAGVTECTLDLAAWARLSQAHPLLSAAGADVEAVLVSRADADVECFVVPVDAVAVRCQIRTEPHRRRYSEAEAERLHDLFGDRSRWADTLKPLQFTTVPVMVPGFTGSTGLDLPVPFTYDLQISATRYFASLDDGEVPLLLLFSGTVFATVDGRLQVQQVPWSKEISCGLPAEVWR